MRLRLSAPVSVLRLVAVQIIDPPFSRTRFKSSYSMDRYEKEPLSVQERILLPTSAAQKEAREADLKRMVLESAAALGETPRIPRSNDRMMRGLERLAERRT